MFTEAFEAASRATWVHAASTAGFTDDRGMSAVSARRTAAVAQASGGQWQRLHHRGPFGQPLVGTQAVPEIGSSTRHPHAGIES